MIPDHYRCAVGFSGFFINRGFSIKSIKSVGKKLRTGFFDFRKKLYFFLPIVCRFVTMCTCKYVHTWMVLTGIEPTTVCALTTTLKRRSMLKTLKYTMYLLTKPLQSFPDPFWIFQIFGFKTDKNRLKLIKTGLKPVFSI